MPDFTKILSRNTSSIKAPSALPIGDYPAVIRQHGMAEKRRKQQQSCVFRLTAQFTGWPDQEDFEPDPEVKITSRSMAVDYYADDVGGEDQTWRLIKLAEALDIPVENRELSEILPEFIGKQVLVQVQHYTNAQSGEIGNQTGKVVALVD